jgi:hypothetical protein
MEETRLRDLVAINYRREGLAERFQVKAVITLPNEIDAVGGILQPGGGMHPPNPS